MIIRSTVFVISSILALILLLNDSARAQERILFEHLGVRDGLSQGSIICVFQDSKGFLWFGTQDGLNKFDGYDFKIFKHDPADKKTINDNFILSIGEDSAGNLWVGTLSNPTLLDRFDRVNETFVSFQRDSLTVPFRRMSSTHPEYTDPSGVRWSGTVGDGLNRFNPRTGKTKVYKHDTTNTQSLLDDRVYSVVGDRTGAIWIGTRNGLERFDPKTELFTHFRHDDNNPGSLSNDFVWPILEDRNGTIWVGTYSGGLNRFDRATSTFTRFRHDESDPRSLAGDQIYSLYQDSSGMIWVGMGDHGVDRFNPGLGGFAHLLHDPSTPNTLVDNNILAMQVDHRGRTWIGTRGGVNRWDKKTETFTLFTHDPKNPRSLINDLVQVILEDRSGSLWLGTDNNGLDRFDDATGAFTHYQNNPGDSHSLSDNRVYALCEDRAGALWVGTYGGGLCRFDRNTQRFTTYMHADSIPTSLGAPGVWSLFEDRDSIVWVGTFGGGLDRFDRATGTFKHFRHNDAEPGSLSDDIVLSMCQDRTGAFWIGTTNGLNRYHPEDGTFRVYHEKDGLANDVVFGILEDDAGHLWMSTNKGLSRFDVTNRTFRSYNYNDGLQGNEFNQGAYAKDPRTGEMYFGGGNGITVFHPGAITNNPYIPPIVFSAFTRYNTDDAQGRPILETGIDSKDVITLSYKDNVANFKFAALNFHNTFKNRYAYRLVGYNENWIQLGADRTATFTNLDAGTYTLQVRGSNNDGVWNEAGASLRLIVTPPWWRTTWAYGIYGVLIFALLFSLRQFEINRREQKARMRESELHAKAMEAEKRALQAENDRKTKELDDARILQLSMLPKEVPRLPGYDIAVFMKTATEVGGDYYDFNLTSDGMLNVAFGDATGHGMQAGTIVTLMKGLFISDSARFDIKTFFNHCSKAIKEIKLGRLYMALTLARFNGKSVSLSSAGMPPAYLYRGNDGSIEEILLKAMPLGAMKNFPYSLYETTMETGDTLLLLTDGLPEQKNAREEFFDYSRVLECFKEVAVSAPDDIIRRLVSEADTWMDGILQDDDITLMVIRKQEEPTTTPVPDAGDRKELS